MNVPLAAVGIVSAASLAYEVMLIRLFSIVQWHHFAYMAISIALLGFGASGTFLALFRRRLLANVPAAFAANAALFGVFALTGFALAQRLPFNALAVIWDPGQLAWLPALYLLLALPFFCGATCVGLALTAFPQGIARIYRYDLMGAGTGALAVVALLFAAPPMTALGVVAAAGPLAAALVQRGRRLGQAALLLLGLALAGLGSWTPLQPSEWKGLSQTLAVAGAELVGERSSPLGLVSAVRNRTVPFRHAPGLSLNAPSEPPPQVALFTDGEGFNVITAFDGRLEPLAYLDYTGAALPYHLLAKPRVLVLGAGGGADVLQALYHGAASIDAVELDPEVVRLVRETFADFAGRLYDRPTVRVHAAEARGFVASTDERFDLIQIPLLDSFSTAAANLGLNESYVYTVEAFEQYLAHLEPGGFLAITRWLKLPPRDALKLVATARAALERLGVDDAGQRLALLRTWNTTTLVLKNGRLEAGELALVRAFAQARSFDLAYLPGLRAEEANRFHVLDRDDYFAGVTALLGPESEDFLERYKFALRPATDDRPYFFNFFKWRALPELLERRALGGAALLDWGHLVLAATLAQAALLGLGLILLPLGFLRPGARRAGARWRVAVYFLSIGLAFLFIEIATIQRFMLLLGNPLYAVAAVLSSFLLFAGLGSGVAPALERRLPGGAALYLAVGAIGLLALAYAFGLPPVFRALMGLSGAAKIALTLVLIAPLAFAMGIPFPLALSRVAASTPELVPWAWALNGCASVLSAILAALIAMSLGFAAVVAIASALYVLAAAALPRQGGNQCTAS